MTEIIISSGEGPEECQIAVDLFACFIMKKVGTLGLKGLTLDPKSGPRSKAVISFDEAGLRPDDLQRLRAIYLPYFGTVRWICQSPLRPSHGRKNWFIKVFESNKSEGFVANMSPGDVRFENFRASGNGGQNLQKNMTAVRAIHKPTGLRVVSSDERSLEQNKKNALRTLQAKLEEAHRKLLTDQGHQIFLSHHSLERGNEVAIFAGPDFRPKD